jgi:malate dehydrogenase (oxaloacetate-decarboxylating)(NADP+)
VLTPDMLRGMEANPIIFALANPNPEIMPDIARATRSDAIIATGRSDFPNQVNNVLGFPYIFRGALDVRATGINEEMKLAAVKAIADLAREDVPEDVLAVYKEHSHYEFGRDYLIPKPVDQRVLLRVAPAVAEAAMKSGVARRKINISSYREKLQRFLGPTRRLIRSLRKDIASRKFKKKPRVVVCNGEDSRILKAAKQVYDNGEVGIVLLGNMERIHAQAASLGIKSLEGIDCCDPLVDPRCSDYASALFELRKRKGISKMMAAQVIHSHDYLLVLC